MAFVYYVCTDFGVVAHFHGLIFVCLFYGVFCYLLSNLVLMIFLREWQRIATKDSKKKKRKEKRIFNSFLQILCDINFV